MRRRVFLATVVAFALGLAAVSATSADSSEHIIAYTPHGQISFFSDDEFTSENGVTGGSGTYEDPYVIEGWSIDISDIESDGSGVLMGGIHIGNTMAYLTIRNVLIQGDYSPADASQGVGITGNHAILMYFGANVLIENCVLKNTTCGIDIRGMDNVVIRGNTITGNSRGVDIQASSQVIMEDNSVADSQFGNVLLEWISDSTVKNNTVSGSDEWMGMNLYDSDNCDLLNNTISNNPNIGLNVGFCRNCRIAGNTFSNNRIGIEIYGEENVILEENTFTGNEENIEDLSDGPSYLGLAIVTSMVAVAAIIIATYLLLKKGEPKRPSQ